jgi:hypothetical protein
MSFSNIARGFNRGKIQREIYKKKVYIVSLRLKPQAIVKLDLIIILKKTKNPQSFVVLFILESLLKLFAPFAKNLSGLCG